MVFKLMFLAISAVLKATEIETLQHNLDSSKFDDLEDPFESYPISDYNHAKMDESIFGGRKLRRRKVTKRRTVRRTVRRRTTTYRVTRKRPRRRRRAYTSYSGTYVNNGGETPIGPIIGAIIVLCCIGFVVHTI